MKSSIQNDQGLERNGQKVLTNAAGTAKTVETALAILDTTSPSVVLGSFTLQERLGNPGTVDYFSPNFSLNVRGIPSPPPAVWMNTIDVVARKAHSIGKRVIVSVAAFNPSEYSTLASIALGCGADAIELNFGCPNMQDEGKFAPIFSYRPEMVSATLNDLPKGEFWAKVSPIFDDVLFDRLFHILQSSDLYGVVAVNTLPQCLALDKNVMPVLSFGTGVGGMAGPAIKPIALAQVARYARAGLRVIGVGGISTGSDLREYLSVGAESVQVNTIIQTEGPEAIDRIVTALQ